MIVLVHVFAKGYMDSCVNVMHGWGAIPAGGIDLRPVENMLNEIKAFMESREEDTTLLSDAEWLLDLAFLTDMTEKLNQLNTKLQGNWVNNF